MISYNYPGHFFKLVLINIIFFLLYVIFGEIFDYVRSFLLVILLLFSSIFFFYTLDKPQFVLLVALVSVALGPFGSIIKDSQLPLTLFQVLTILTVFLFFVKRISQGDIQYKNEKVFFSVYLFLFLIIISTAYSQDKARAFFLIVTMITLFIMTYMTKELFIKKSYFNIFFFATLVITIVLSAYAIFQFIKDPTAILLNALNTQSKVFGRSIAVWEDPNDFAIILVFPLLFIIAKILIGRKTLGKALLLFLLISFVIIFGAFLTTYSRSGWLSFFLSAFFLFIITKNTKNLLYLSLIGIIVIAILSLNEVFYQAIVNRILSIANITSNTSNTARILLADAGVQMFIDSNFLGFGYMSFPVLAANYFNPVLTQYVIESHNVSLTLLAELGLIGFIIFYVMYFSFFSIGIKTIKNNTDTDILIYSSTITSYLIALIVFFQLYPGCFHSNYIWFSFGALIALSKMKNSAVRDLKSV